VVSSADLSSLRISRESDTDPNRRRYALIALGVVVLLLLGVAAVVVMRDRAVEVKLAIAELRGGSAGGGLTANGYVVARTKASVSSRLSGRLAYLGVEEGDRVAAGQVIARLESAEYDALVLQAKAEVLAAEAQRIEAEATLAQAVRGLERARALAKTELVARQALEDAETAHAVATARVGSSTARVAAAKQALAAAEASLENTRVRAPFSGTILRKDAEVGEVVAPSVAGGGLTRGAVVTMADLTTLEVEVDVNEAYIGSVEHAQRSEVVLDAYPGVTFPGHVRQVVPTADRQKATVLVRVAIESRDPRILPEMGARVVFLEAADAKASAEPSRVFIPAATARAEGAETVVYVVVNERVERRVIEVGPVSGEAREVRRGLRGGEKLVVDPPAGLAEGTRVRIVENPNARSN